MSRPKKTPCSALHIHQKRVSLVADWENTWSGSGFLIGALAPGVGYIYWRIDPNGNWQTMTFTTLAFSQMAQALATRSRCESLFQIGIRSNPAGMGLAVLVFGLQLAALYVPFLQGILYTKPLSLSDLTLSLSLGMVVFIAIEIEKWSPRRAG